MTKKMKIFILGIFVDICVEKSFSRFLSEKMYISDITSDMCAILELQVHLFLL